MTSNPEGADVRCIRGVMVRCTIPLIIVSIRADLEVMATGVYKLS